MRWMEAYRSKIKTADETAGVIKSGDRVFVHQGCAEPQTLLDAMLRRAPELRDVEVIHMATMGKADYTLPESEPYTFTNFIDAYFFRGPPQTAIIKYIGMRPPSQKMKNRKKSRETNTPTIVASMKRNIA